ncbi:Cytochrome c biogenesis protein CcmG [Legionella massiliensis]|uniref:Cytochrome c biogenesis protein CcmG n=1 Tax=Legionella massiliensis TaxID=1034943 RepID=A0A078KWY8_9GAMM|nr:DsbE family thiol:disulfide interchange protein [Legionella massiliensis]CDZ78920.1 Cytochrome c biogenesis protein CcmG [Legionella massiliensis]CEE14658.1 Thiol:disulfide interchange protein DsbE [Legionella massiliensis]
MKTLYWRLIPLAIFTLLVFFFWRGLSLEPQKLPSVQLGKSLPDFQLPMLGDEKHFTPQAMRGQVALLNVWASWCAACVEEQVFLMRLARESVPIYGLNYKDDTDNAARWLNEWGNPYQAIGEDKEGKVAIDLGVYGAPETFLIDKKGIIRYRHVGILDEETWKTEFLPRIQQLQGEA